MRGRFIFDVAHNPRRRGRAGGDGAGGGRPRPESPPCSRSLTDKDWRGVMAAGAGGGRVRADLRVPTAPASAEPKWGVRDARDYAQSRGWESVGARFRPRDRGGVAAGGDGARHRLLSHRRRRHGSLAGRSAGRVAFPDVRRSAPGFRDFYPKELADATPLSRLAGCRARFAFEEYDGAPLEPLELYTRKERRRDRGAAVCFTDKGGREVALRPEMTPSFARIVAARANAKRKPVRCVLGAPALPLRTAAEGGCAEHFNSTWTSSASRTSAPTRTLPWRWRSCDPAGCPGGWSRAFSDRQLLSALLGAGGA